jgi:hypothetical protein
MTECIHGLEENQCGVCGTSARRSTGPDGTMVGKSFALVFAPTFRDDTFLHLNREGDHWKFRSYSSPSRPATELAQSGKASTLLVLDLRDVEFLHEIAYPYSTSPEGVSVTNFRYWYDEIAKLNAAHNIGG